MSNKWFAPKSSTSSTPKPTLASTAPVAKSPPANKRPEPPAPRQTNSNMTPPVRPKHLRHTQRIDIAKLLRASGRLDPSGHAPLLHCTFVRSFDSKGQIIDRYDCRTRVQRHGHPVEQRTLVDIGRDGSMRIAPKIDH